MLVMRRRAGDALLIGPEIEIEILEVGPTRVKLGIIAPAGLSIVRKEVSLTRESNRDAAQTASPEAIARLFDNLMLGDPGTSPHYLTAVKKLTGNHST